MSDLLTTDFLRKLERLALLARRLHQGTLRAERKSHRLGSSLEFADHRAYTGGDDLRTVDWNLYGRHERLFVKLYEDEEDIPAYILVDASQSMRWDPGSDTPGAPAPKLDLARQVAAALAYIALAGHDRVELLWFSHRLGPTTGLLRGKSALPRLLTFLAHPPAPDTLGPTNLAQVAADFTRSRRRRGLIILLSDFLTPHGHQAPLRALLARRFELRLIHLLHPLELNPTLDGDFRLQDSETGATLDIAATPALLARHKTCVENFLRALSDFARQNHATHLHASADTPFDTLVLRLLRETQLIG